MSKKVITKNTVGKMLADALCERAIKPCVEGHYFAEDVRDYIDKIAPKRQMWVPLKRNSAATV